MQGALAGLDLANPVNRTHPYAPDAWWLCVPGLMGGAQWHDVMGLGGGPGQGLGVRSGQGHHAELVTNISRPDATRGWQAGSSCPGSLGMLAFNGTTDVASVGDHAFFVSGIKGMTWILDVFPRTVSGFRGLVGKGSLDSASVGSYQIYMNGSTYAFIVLTGGTRQLQLSAAGTVVQGVWQQVATNWQASATGALFVNGVKKTSAATGASIDTSSDPLILGGNAGSYYYDGFFASVRFYRRVFSDQAMMQLYQHSRNGSPGLLRSVAQPRVGAAAVLNRRSRGARIGSRMVP